MILKHLGVRGYKSLKNVTVDFTPITVFVGDSDCGKTNLFSVFTLLQAESYRQVPKSARLTFDTSLFYGDEKETPALSVKASGDSGQSGLVASLEADGKIHRRFQTVGTFFPHGRLAWRVYRFTEASLMRTTTGKAHYSTELFTDGSNLPAVLLRLKTEYPDNYARIGRLMKLFAPEWASFDFEVEQTMVRLLWVDQAGRRRDSTWVSDGTMRFLATATLLSLPESMVPRVLMIDDYDVGISRKGGMLLTEALRSVAIQHQVVVSVQTSDGLDEFDPEEVVWCEKTDDGSRFARPNLEKLQTWFTDGVTLSELRAKNVLADCCRD